MMIVNTASKCGFTPQYNGLEALYQKYRDKWFAIVGFPCDQFAHQEPESDDQIAEFCRILWNFTKFLINRNSADIGAWKRKASWSIRRGWKTRGR